MKALILCAGKGTRLGLKRTPKAMVKINKKPVLEYLVNHLNKHGVNEIIVNISDHADYTKIFKYFGTRLLYFYEPVLMGEAGTELALLPWLGEEYIVMNGDTLTNVDITEMSKGYLNKMFYKERFGGTKVVQKWGMPFFKYEEKESYYFDIGTPKGLAKARRFYATNK